MSCPPPPLWAAITLIGSALGLGSGLYAMLQYLRELRRLRRERRRRGPPWSWLFMHPN